MFNTHIATLLIASLLTPLPAFGADAVKSYQEDFIITAYYSPLPGQCCYVTGSYESDVALNGNGTNGADGTAVYPGMAAAPASYAFGTRIALPGMGVVTVHDRGGAIVDLENDVHRLDLWAGAGEEGLARALSFGVKRVKGTVYPVGSAAPAESLTLSTLPAPVQSLEAYIAADATLLAVHPKAGDRGYSVLLMQKYLHEAGYLTREPTGVYGMETQAALDAFIKDMGLQESSAALSDTVAAYLMAATEPRPNRDPFAGGVQRGSAPATVANAQRTLRLLGFYKGRTDGKYNTTLRHAIIAFQKSEGLVANDASTGAGRIGPLTKNRLLLRWKATLYGHRAESLLTLKRLDQLLAQSGRIISSFLGAGEKSDQVKILQKLLVGKGLLDADRVSGFFGEMTKAAVAAYQVGAGIVAHATDKGAGYVGPVTMLRLRDEVRSDSYRVVRAEGWKAL